MIDVLIVDDDAMVAELNRCYLSQVPGFNCCATVATLQQAKELIVRRDMNIDLVLLDVFMKQDNGLDLLPVLREFNEQTDVIIISSASDVNTIKKALQYGVVDYLIKPFQFSRFEEALSAYRQKKALLDKHDAYAQADVDQLMRRTTPALAEEKKLPKGLTAQTLGKICEWINRHSDSEFSTDNVASAVGISRVSCRKYLMYLASGEILSTNILYGTTGRPAFVYQLRPDQHDRLQRYCS